MESGGVLPQSVPQRLGCRYRGGIDAERFLPPIQPLVQLSPLGVLVVFARLSVVTPEIPLDSVVETPQELRTTAQVALEEELHAEPRRSIRRRFHLVHEPLAQEMAVQFDSAPRTHHRTQCLVHSRRVLPLERLARLAHQSRSFHRKGVYPMLPFQHPLHSTPHERDSLFVQTVKRTQVRQLCVTHGVLVVVMVRAHTMRIAEREPSFLMKAPVVAPVEMSTLTRR